MMATSLSPTQVTGKHNAIYEAYYAYVDPNGHGTICAMDAARFLKKSGLSDVVLSRVWDLSDPSGRGCLDKTGIFVALKLVALAQAGQDLNMSNINLDMPPPKMGDIPLTLSKKAMPPTSIPYISSIAPAAVDWTIKSLDREKYNKTFDSLQPVNGLIPGNIVKGVLMESKLPIDALGQIWELADQDKDGSLNRDEFVAAMHLVYKALEKHAIPSVLPPELITTSVVRKTSTSLAGVVNMDGTREKVSSIPILPHVTPSASVEPPLVTSFTSDHLTLSSNGNAITHNRLTSNVSLLSGLGGSTTGALPTGRECIATIGQEWVVSIEERVKSDMLFLKSDIDHDGFVSGMEIKDVFLQSGVQQSILAHIWALCDIRQSGKLNSEQFALAMWFVAKCLTGQEPPTTLAPDMVPPSFRTTSIDKPRTIENNNLCYSNPDMEMISKDIEELSREKLSLEMDISQKEASIHVKNGEIKSLQSELDTLAATLKQLDTQKGEAHKRLGDLKNQVDKLRMQASEQADVISSEEAELLNRKEQLENLKQEELRLEHLKQKNGEMLNGLGSKLQSTQLNISQAKALISQLEEQTRQMNDAITACDSAIESGDALVITDATLILNPDFRESQYSRLGVFNGSTKDNHFCEMESDHPCNNNTEFSVDPFRNEHFNSHSNSYGSTNNLKSAFSSSNDQYKQDPFNKFSSNNAPNTDPFDAFGDGNNASVTPEPNKDAFGCDPFAVLHAPTRDEPLGRAASPSPVLPPKKAKPPRPAPPRPQPPSINKAGSATDQFGSTGFADFANFDDEFSLATSPRTSSLSSNTFTSEPAGKLEFTDDPFRDYRYEDPFNIAFEEEDKFDHDNGTTSVTALPSVPSLSVNIDSLNPTSTGRLSAPLHNILKSSDIGIELSSNSGRSSVPLNFEDERLQII